MIDEDPTGAEFTRLYEKLLALERENEALRQVTRPAALVVARVKCPKCRAVYEILTAKKAD